MLIQKVAVAGCGAMGLPMAQALLAAGYVVLGYDIRSRDEFGPFAEYMVGDPGQLNAADALIVVVRDAQQLAELCFGNQGIYTSAPHPPILIVSSTVSPRSITELRSRLPAAVAMLDAPMSGAPIAAEERRLSFMLGGDSDLIGSCEPLFQAMGKHLFRVGPLGQGMAAKVFNNYVAACGVVAVRHALGMAAEWGIGQNQLIEIMRRSSGSTWYGDNIERISWSREGYSPDNTIGIISKDVAAALEASRPPGDGGALFATALQQAITELGGLDQPERIA